MSIPTLLICDGDDEQQTRLESLIKGDSSFRYIATVSKQDGQMAIEQGIKVGVKLVWMDLNDEPDACYTLMAQSKQVHPELPIIISKRGLDPETIRYSLNAGALECLEEATAQVQLKIVAAKLGVAAPAQATAPAAQAQAAQAQTAPAQPGSQTAGSSKWGDLDSIPTPGAAKHNQELTGEIHVGTNPGVGVASSTQTQALQQTSPAGQSGSRWGDLDSIPTPGQSAGASRQGMSAMPAQTQAPAPAPTPAPTAQATNQAESKWGDLDAIPTPKAKTEPEIIPPSPAQEKAITPSQAPAASAAPATANSIGGGGSQWGDLDAIPTPSVKAQPERPSFGSGGALGETDAPSTPPKPLMPHDHSSQKGLRPSPEKAELYTLGAAPMWLIAVIILIIFGAIAYFMMRPH